MSNYSTFTFYGSWRVMLDAFEKSIGEEYAAKALYNLMLMATAGEVRTEDPLILGFINGCCMPNIEASQDRYARACNGGLKGGRPKTLSKQDNDIIAAMRAEGKKQIEIAEYFNVSVDTIRRTDGWQNWQNYIAKPAKLLQENSKTQSQETAKPAKPGSKMQNLEKELELELELEKENKSEFDKLTVEQKQTYFFEYGCFINSGYSKEDASKMALEVALEETGR